MGGESQVSMINMVIASGFGLFALMQLNWHLALGALFFAFPVQWCIRAVTTRHDPQFFSIYFRAMRVPYMREPH